MESLPLKDQLLKEDDLDLHVMSAKVHFGDIERNIRNVKCACSTTSVLLFKALPKLMKIALLKLTAF